MAVRERLDAAWHWLKQNQTRRAQAAATDVLAQSPDCAEAWHILGLGRYAAGDSIAALQALARAECLAPAQTTTALNHVMPAFFASWDGRQKRWHGWSRP